MSLQTLNDAVDAAFVDAKAKATELLLQLSADVESHSKNNTTAAALATALATKMSTLATAVAAIAFPTVTISSLVYDILKPKFKRKGVLYTAEQLSADATLGAELLAASARILRIHKPTANFTGSATSGAHPVSITFTDSSTNAPTSWAWTFGDGGTSTSQNPVHSYAAAGTYTVTLIATNAGGSDTKTRTSYIVVS